MKLPFPMSRTPKEIRLFNHQLRKIEPNPSLTPPVNHNTRK